VHGTRSTCLCLTALLLAGPATAFFQPAALGRHPPGVSLRRAGASSRGATTRPSALTLSARFMGDARYNPNAMRANELSRKDLLVLIAAGSAALVAPGKAAPEDLNNKPVVVFGAGGYTGGDVVRSLLKQGKTVIPVTRRPVTISDRSKIGADSLVLDNIADKDRVKPVTADVLKPETLAGIMEGAGAVIFCAASRPKVKVTVTPGTQPGGNRDMTGANMMSYMETRTAGVVPKGGYIESAKDGKMAPPSDNVEDVGLINVAKEVRRLGIERLVVVSSVCAKCQKKDGKPEYDAGDMVDKGAASCDACYKKQAGEDGVKDLYVGAPANMGYTIVRPGMLSPGEERGIKNVEFNQGVSKSGIISRLDLAEVLVAAASTKSANGKTFEVYYRDTAQPVDMYASLKSCKELGKSVKECFFGEGYDEAAPVSLDEIMKKPLQGTLFASGSEVQGNSYSDMFSRLKADKEQAFDLGSLASDSVM
jgi:nucleoside-diphosphate-sugar epimerase